MKSHLHLIALAAFTGNVFAAEDHAILSGEINRLNNQSLLWGPYKPNLYFGVRPRLPESLWTGLMWSKMQDYTDLQHRKLLSSPG